MSISSRPMPQGDTLWTRTYGGTDDDEGHSVQQTADGGYIIAGYDHVLRRRRRDVYLIKTNASGRHALDQNLWRDSAMTRATRSSRPLMAATSSQARTSSFGAGSYDVYLIKTDASGDTLWTRTYGGPDGDRGHSVQQTADGGYIIAGSTNSFGAGRRDVYLIKTNAQGDTLWTRTYGGSDDDAGQLGPTDR